MSVTIAILTVAFACLAVVPPVALAASVAAVTAAAAPSAANGIKRISAGNYGGKLGQFQFHLREIMA